LACRASELAGQVDGAAGSVDGARNAEWVSTRAQGFKDDLAQDAMDIRAAIGELHQAGRALRRHAAEIDGRCSRSACPWVAPSDSPCVGHQATSVS
jgi:hypothetical protein